MNTPPSIMAGVPPGKEPDGDEGMAPAAPAAGLDSVPMDALAMPDDQDAMQPPEVGDEVSYTVTGKVVSIDGPTAKVQRTSINGQDLPGAGDNDGDEAGADEASGLREQAGAMGNLQ